MTGSSRRRASRRRLWRPVQADTDTEVSTEVSPQIHNQAAGPLGPDGERGTCYAFAVATAIRSAQMRIFGRAVESHAALVKGITREFGYNGANLYRVLDAVCPSRNLRHRPIDRDAAAQLVQGYSRVVIARFALTDAAWRRFTKFFEDHPDESLRQRHIFSNPEERSQGDRGHAVVIVGASHSAWFIKNSWGDAFAHEGYFHVRKTALPLTFHDVYFCTNDLTRKERAVYWRAPAVLDIYIPDPQRSPRNPISSLGWGIDFETLRVERVRKRNCSIAHWNRQHPYNKVMPGYQVSCVNGHEGLEAMIWELQHAEAGSTTDYSCHRHCR